MGKVKAFFGSILSKAFSICLWSSLWLLLALHWIHPRADLMKGLNTCAGNENFIPTKFHKHPSSGSVVKADCVFHIYTCISTSPFLHLNKYIKNTIKFKRVEGDFMVPYLITNVKITLYKTNKFITFMSLMFYQWKLDNTGLIFLI